MPLRIRIIDSNRTRGSDLYVAIRNLDTWSQDKSLVWNFSSSFREATRDQGAELVLCHLNDLPRNDSGYVEDCNAQGIAVVLYSGEMTSFELAGSNLEVTTNEGPRHFVVKNPECLLVIPYNVLSASRLPIEAALEAYEAEPDETRKRAALFGVLRDFNPELEAKLDLLYFLEKSPSKERVEAWKPAEIPGLTNDEKQALRNQATDFFRVPNQEPQMALRKLRDELLGT